MSVLLVLVLVAAAIGGGLLTLRPSHFIAASTDLAAIPEDLPCPG